MTRADELYYEDVRAALTAIAPYPQIVVVGGLVPWFYRHHPEFHPPALPPDRTRDIDIAVPRDLPASPNTLDQRLAAAGFVTLHNRATTPPVTLFQPARYGTDELGESFIEVLVPAVGRREPSVVRLQHHPVVAQRLRYMDLALDHAITFDAARVPELHAAAPLPIRIPHPASFIVHKLLVMPLRNPRKFGRDAAYLYDVALTTRRAWTSFVPVLAEMASSPARVKWIAAARANANHWFSRPTSNGALEASAALRSLHPGGPSAAEVSATLTALLETLWPRVSPPA